MFAGSEHVPHLPAAVFKGLVTGLQSVSKGRQGPEAANDVQVPYSDEHLV